MVDHKQFEGWYFDSPDPFGHLSNKANILKGIDWSMSHTSQWDRVRITLDTGVIINDPFIKPKKKPDELVVVGPKCKRCGCFNSLQDVKCRSCGLPQSPHDLLRQE